MKKIIYSLFLLAAATCFVSCDKYDDPTYDVVVYDKTKVPTIESGSLPLEMMADEVFEWEVRVEAFNGIKEIRINDDVVVSYGDGQLIHEGNIEITMPDDVTSLDLVLKVEDELGNVTSTPNATIQSKGFIPSPYMLIDFSGAGVVLATGDALRPSFPIANGEAAALSYTNNCGWYDVAITSDAGFTQILYGMPSMNTANNSTKWAQAAAFGMSDIYSSTQKAMSLRNHFTDAATAAGVTVADTKWKPMPTFSLSKLILPSTLNETLVKGLIDGERVFKMDIYVDTSAAASAATDPDAQYNYNALKHGKVALGMACVSRFNNSNSSGLKRSGQFGGVMADIPETDKWVSLTFSSRGSTENPFTEQSPTPIDPPTNSEVDMLTLYVSPQSGSGNVASNAKYYIKNLRIEKVE